MKLNLDSIRKDHFLIKSCGQDFIQINDQSFTQSIIVCVDQSPQLWSVNNIDRLAASSVEEILQITSPELVLIGTGACHSFPAAETLVPLLDSNIGYEIMDTAAACRTYNVLAGEGRRVAAGLILSG